MYVKSKLLLALCALACAVSIVSCTRRAFQISLIAEKVDLKYSDSLYSNSYLKP